MKITLLTSTLSLLGVFLSGSAFADAIVSEPMIQILEKTAPEWRAVPTNSTNPYLNIFHELQKMEIYSTTLEYENSYFDRSADFLSMDHGYPHFELKSDNRWFEYEFAIKDQQYKVVRILDEGNRERYTRRTVLFDVSENSAFVKAQIRRYRRTILNCRMNSFGIKKILEARISKWKDSLPSYANDYRGYKGLFNDLKKATVFREKTIYTPLLFNRSYDFSSSAGGFFSILLEDRTVYEYRFESARPGVLVLSHSDDCSEAELAKQIREQANLLAGLPSVEQVKIMDADAEMAR